MTGVKSSDIGLMFFAARVDEYAKAARSRSMDADAHRDAGRLSDAARCQRLARAHAAIARACRLAFIDRVGEDLAREL